MSTALLEKLKNLKLTASEENELAQLVAGAERRKSDSWDGAFEIVKEESYEEIVFD